MPDGVTVDLEAWAEATGMSIVGKEVVGEDHPDSEPTITRYHQELARFLACRIEEVKVLQAFNMTTDGRPWSRQPWWKTRIWMSYMAGDAEGQKEKNK